MARRSAMANWSTSTGARGCRCSNCSRLKERLPKPATTHRTHDGMNDFDPVNLAFVLALLALVPVMLIVSTSFLKIAVVLAIMRNALGIQQVPPNMVLYALALILSMFIMAPVGNTMWMAMEAQPGDLSTVDGLMDAIQVGADPLRSFLVAHSGVEHRGFFLHTAQRLWGPEMSAG